MQHIRRSLMMLVVVGSCRGGSAEFDPVASLREQARTVLFQHCGECHDPSRSTSLPRALAVFDVSERDWSSRMSDAQLRNALWRLGEPIPPEGRPNDVSDAERALFSRYVDAELQTRAKRAQ